MAAGISNGGAFQPSFSRAPAISSAPSGEPWLFSLPALFRCAETDGGAAAGDQRGRSDALAASSAAAIAAGSWPSMRCRPAGDSKRFA
jgi:hypothetical protein